MNNVSFYPNACDSIQWEDLVPSPTEPLISESSIFGHSVQKVFDPTNLLYLTKDTTYQVTFIPENPLTEFSISYISPAANELFPELSQGTANQFPFDFDDKPIKNELITTDSTSLNHSRLSHDLTSAKPQTPHKQPTHIEPPENESSNMTIHEICRKNNQKIKNRLSAERCRNNKKKHIQAMESKLDLQQVASIKSICREKINNIKEFEMIKKYLDRNQKNNNLVKKYGTNSLSNSIIGDKKNIDSVDLVSFNFLKRKAKNSCFATKSRFFISEYIKKLESAVEATSPSPSGVQTPS